MVQLIWYAYLYGGGIFVNGNYIMREYPFKKWVKYIVLKVGIFESEIIDEQNFDAADEMGIMKFKRKYIKDDECVLVEVEMWKILIFIDFYILLSYNSKNNDKNIHLRLYDGGINRKDRFGSKKIS